MERRGTEWKVEERIVTHFVHGSVHSAVLYIVQDSVVEQHGVLRNDADALDA